MQVLSKLGIPTANSERIAAAKAAEIQVDDRSTIPELEPKANEPITVSVIPGGGDWLDYAVHALDTEDPDEINAWLEAQVTAQLKLLGLDPELADIPPWAAIPYLYPAAIKVSGIFLAKSGAISYARFPQAELDKLPDNHPRKAALRIQGKFGANKVKHSVLAYCIEHPIGKSGLNDAALAEKIKAGGFIKLLKMNMPTYKNLKEARVAMVQMGKSDLPNVHLVCTLQDQQFQKIGFQVNIQQPAWHKPELLALVLQEVHKLGPVSKHTPYRELSDTDFAAAVTKAVESTKSAGTPEN